MILSQGLPEVSSIADDRVKFLPGGVYGPKALSHMQSAIETNYERYRPQATTLRYV